MGLRSNRKNWSGLIHHLLRAEKNTRMKGSLLTSGFPSPLATIFVVISLSVAFAGISAAESGDEESQTEKLANETQNPIGNLISVPFQNNFNFGLGKLPVN